MEEVVNRRLRKRKKEEARWEGSHRARDKGQLLVNPFGKRQINQRGVRTICRSLKKTNVTKRCGGNRSWFLHVLSLCMNAHPPVSPCSESRKAGEVGGRATLSLSVSGARWQLLGEAWGCRLLLGWAISTSWKDSVEKSCMLTATNGRKPEQPEIKAARCLLGPCTNCVNIWGISVWLHGMQERHDGQRHSVLRV